MGPTKIQQTLDQDWMKVYNVSLRTPNKKYAIKREDRII